MNLTLHGELTRGAAALRFDLDVAAGETLALVGPNGAGKSTCVQLLAGLLPLASGHLQLGAQAFDAPAAGTFVPPEARAVGYLPQQPLLFPHLSVRDNLLYGWRRRHESARRLDPATVYRLLEIGPLLDRRCGQLSGGERQRVALGRALLFSPRLLLLDEPLAALDARLQQQILPFLGRIKTETGIPMIYVSHRAEEVRYLADRVLWLHNGRLHDQGGVATGAGAGGLAADAGLGAGLPDDAAAAAVGRSGV